MPLASGTRLGPYEITAPLGTGGMGEVYRATDLKLGREVAIKVLPDAFANDPDRMARFTREAQVLASLNHPNIAAIYGLEENAIVMELVEGSDLRGPLPLETALAYAGQIADALEAAHEKGITHRDLKPANVKITPQGVVKVLDFGLAKIAEPVAGPGNPMSSPTLTMRATEAGMILGTAAYMAPEQARGQIVDKRADIWAFGVVLWEMITGKRMFNGETISDVLAAVLTKPPDLNAVPAQVRRLLARCLEKDPRKRLRDIAVWRDLLEETPPTRTSTTKLPWIAAVLLATGLVLSLWWPHRIASDRPMLQMDLDVGDKVSNFALSPDGLSAAYVSKGQLAIRRLDQERTTALPGTEGAFNPFFSPDGLWLAFFNGAKLQKIAVAGGLPVVLCDAAPGASGSWGEDGNIVAALLDGGGLFKVPASGGRPEPLTNLKDEPKGVYAHRWPQVLPGGKGVLFTASLGRGKGAIKVLAPGGRSAKELIENSDSGRYLAGGYLIYYQGGTLFAASMDLNRLALTGSVFPIANGVTYDVVRGAAFDVSSGTLLYQKGSPANKKLVSWLDSSNRITPVLVKPAEYAYLRLSPDGKRLALVISPQLGQLDLWVYDLRRETMIRLAFGSSRNSYPVWSPNGEYLAFSSTRALGWARSNGSGRAEIQASTDKRYPSSFSPDGKWLTFFQEGAQTPSALWITPVDWTTGAMRLGAVPVPLLPQAASAKWGPAISPDGRWLAYCSSESTRFETYVIPFSPEGENREGQWQVSNAGGVWPVWSSDGRELFYRSLDRRVMAVGYAANGDVFVPEKPRVWAEKQLADFVTGPTFDVAPDGKRVIAVFDAEESKPETHLRVLLNVGDELRRRTGAK